MKIIKASISFLLLFVLSYGVSNAQELFLYSAAPEECNGDSDAPSTLYIIDPETALSKAIGPIGFNKVTGLAILGDGRLVGTANADDGSRVAIFIEIDRSSGQGSLIGVIGDEDNPGECGRVPDITYDPATDTLYGIGFRCDVGSTNQQFLSINQATGQATIIGDTGFRGGGNALAMRDDGTFFWSNVRDDESRIFTIDPLDGAATLVINKNADTPFFSAFAFHPVTQVLYGTDINPPLPLMFFDAVLDTVDTDDGQVTRIGDPLPSCTDALIFANIARPIPSLSEWGLIAMAGILGIVGFIVMRRRNVTA
jgi:exosortase sorting signal-containing protein